MPHYFASDVHLRLDKPDRSERFARFVNALDGEDALFVVGDLYDFWFVSRQQRIWEGPCEAESALIKFRERGGQLRILSGNHDTWLGPFIEKTFGVAFEREPLELDLDGVPIRIVHGHLFSRGLGLKVFMESRLFLVLFSRVPNRIAALCDQILTRRNAGRFEQQNREQRDIFRRAIQQYTGPAKVHVFGHLHERIQEEVDGAKLFVLGDWKESSGYLMVNAGELSFVTDD